MRLTFEQLEPRDTPDGVTPVDPSRVPFDDPKALDPFGVTGIPVEGSGYTFDVTLMSLWIVKVVQGSVGGNP